MNSPDLTDYYVIIFKRHHSNLWLVSSFFGNNNCKIHTNPPNSIFYLSVITLLLCYCSWFLLAFDLPETLCRSKNKDFVTKSTSTKTDLAEWLPIFQPENVGKLCGFLYKEKLRK